MDLPRFASVLMASLFAAGAARADVECRPLRQAVKESSRAGYTGFLYANEIASTGGTSKGIATRSAGASQVRVKLESLVDMSLDAGAHAEEAVERGVIRSGAEPQFVAQVRQHLHASLLRENAIAAWLVVLVHRKTGEGVVWVRRYEFPRDGLAGVMNGAEQLCVRARLAQASRWPLGQPATSLALLGRREQPDCGAAAAAGVDCAGLGSQLERAASEGESVVATARSGPVLWVYTRNPGTGRGRALNVDAAGTTLVDTWLFNVEAPTQ
ncbi:hypothetical protein [Variovorax sp. dw_954]|uniref:hypothetical protein n=1 Tax=Variovorax sp. dw_954 TaxID=2720078 RepID=UPI001BD341BB|nr:hypothetical protein [Variovorax sp. dw_954]